MKPIFAVFQNLNGTRFKKMVIPEFKPSIMFEQCKPISCLEESSLPDTLSISTRKFAFWDREGKLYIYKEIL